MAGDWLKIEKCTPDKFEVLRISQLLGVDRANVFIALLKIWSWFDDNTSDGRACNIDRNTVDLFVGFDGFASAMESVGWLAIDQDTIQLPNFDRHNGETAKQRAMSTRRKQKQRTPCHATSVTKTGPEKRRESDLQSDSSDPIRSEGTGPETTARKRRSSGPDGTDQTGAFSGIDESMLRDIPALAHWLRIEQAQCADPVYREPQPRDLRDIAAAGEHALQFGRKPFRLWCTMVGRRDYTKVSKSTRAVSDQRVAEYLASTKESAK